MADAKDGSSIELKFNGVRPVSEKPFRISGQRVTIRAGRGYHPVISFSPRELPATGFEGRMITLNNASLDLFDVDVQATVPDATNADHWSLFSFGGPDRLTCRNVNITVTNPGNRQAEIVDISSNAPMPARQPNPMGAPPEFEIETRALPDPRRLRTVRGAHGRRGPNRGPRVGPRAAGGVDLEFW